MSLYILLSGIHNTNHSMNKMILEVIYFWLFPPHILTYIPNTLSFGDSISLSLWVWFFIKNCLASLKTGANSVPKSGVLYFHTRPASWSSGQSFWLLIMRSRVRFPALPWEFFLKEENSRSDHGLGSLVEFRFKGPPGTPSSYITTHIIGTM